MVLCGRLRLLSASAPLFLVLNSLIYQSSTYAKFSLVLIGDSIDRFSIIDWCQQGSDIHSAGSAHSTHSNRRLDEWGDNRIKYWFGKALQRAALYCHDIQRNLTGVQLHIYGSNATQPYFKHTSDHFPTGIVEYDTTNRIQIGLELFIRNFGKPNRVIFHSVNWDSGYIIETYPDLVINSTVFHLIKQHFWYEINQRLDQIISIVGSDVDVGLRTAVRQQAFLKVVRHLNDVIRQIAKERKCTLYDYDLDAYSTANYDVSLQYKILRDWIHPNEYIASLAPEKMMGKLYSRYFYPAEAYTAEVTGKSTVEESFLNGTLKVHFVQLDEFNDHQIFFVKYHHYNDLTNNTWDKESKPKYACPVLRSKQFFSWGRYGYGDILAVSNTTFRQISTLYNNREAIKIIDSTEGFIGIMNRSVANSCFIITENGYKRHVPNIDVLRLFQPNISLVFDDFPIECIDAIPSDLPIHDIFKNRTIIRPKAGKAIYVVIDHMKHKAGSMRNLEDHGFNTSKIITVSDPLAFEILPEGPPLSHIRQIKEKRASKIR